MKKLLIPSVLAALVWTGAPKAASAEKFAYPGECYGAGCPKPAPAPAPTPAAAPAKQSGLPDWPAHSEGWGSWQKVNFQRDGKSFTAWCHAEECQRSSSWWTKVKDFFGADTSVTAPLYTLDRRNEKIAGQPLGTVFHSYTTPYNLTLDANGATVKDGKFTAKAELPNEYSLSAPGSGMWVLSPKATKDAQDAASKAPAKKIPEPAKKEEKKPAAKPKEDAAKTPAKEQKQPAKPKEQTPAQPEKKPEPVAGTPEKVKDNLEAVRKAAEHPDQAKEVLENAGSKGNTQKDGTVYAGNGNADKPDLTVQPAPKKKTEEPPPPTQEAKKPASSGPDEVAPAKKAAGPLFGDPNFKYNASSGFKMGVVGSIIGLIFGGPIGALIGFGVGFAAGYALNMVNA